nr:MAG TPA: hypothetical protein [Caudoviricetes sp.]
MTKEQAIERLKKLDYLLDDVYSTGLVEDEERNKYQDAIETVLPMLEEKDKQIDLMAEAMRYYNGMQQEQDFCIEICEKKECNIEKCKDCIKQYFENKAKELLNK